MINKTIAANSLYLEKKCLPRNEPLEHQQKTRKELYIHITLYLEQYI